MADPTRPAAIEDLLAHADWLRALARRLVASDDLASDVEQETWLAAIEHPPRDASAPRKWLAQVLRNIVKEQRRSESARHAREARVAQPEAVAASDESVERAQSLRALIEAVLELDEPYRSTLLLRYQDGLSPEEIAHKQSVPSSTVRNRISRGIALLRERLERRHGSAWSALLLPLVHHDSTATAAATAGGGAIGASVAAITSMATLKIVSAATAVLVVGAAMWWTFSDARPATPRANSAEPPARAEPTLAAQPGSTSSERDVVEAAKPAVPAPKSAPAGARRSLLVSVIWESDGSPASDVVVRLYRWSEPFASTMESATDAQGQARFDDVAQGSVGVSTDRGGSVTVQVSGAEQIEVTVSIPRGIMVRGRVVDGSGEPVALARIWLSAYFNGDSGHEVTKADANGRFELRDVGQARCIAARAAGFSPSPSQSVLGQPGDDVELTIEMLAGGGELRGAVRAPDGTPIAGAAVLVGTDGVHSMRGKDSLVFQSPPPVRTTTDERGEFSAAGIDAGRVNVMCRARGFAPLAQTIDVATVGITRVVFELRTGASIAGTVRDSDGNPAGEVDLGVGGFGSFTSNGATTAADGSFHLESLAPGEATVRFGGGAQGEATATLVLTAGETAHLDVQLAKHGVVAGRVIDESGAALAGWRVGAIEADNPGLHYRSAITDAEGKFTLDNWPENANALEVREENLWNAPPALVVDKVELGRTDLVLTVATASRATAFVVGQLRGPGGEAVPDASLMYGDHDADRQFGAELSATTGEFRMGPMRPGRFELQARSPSMGVLLVPEREVHAGETIDVGELRFATPGRVRVKLTVPHEMLDTFDVRGLYVVAQGPGRFGSGRIEIDDKLEGRSVPLAPGTYTIKVSSSTARAPETAIEVIAGEERAVEIAIERATWRRCRVTWDPSVPLKQPFAFVATDSAGRVVERQKVLSPEEGTCPVGVHGLVVGTYWIDVKTTDGRGAHVSFAVSELSESDDWIEVPLH